MRIRQCIQVLYILNFVDLCPQRKLETLGIMFPIYVFITLEIYKKLYFKSNIYKENFKLKKNAHVSKYLTLLCVKEKLKQLKYCNVCTCIL